MSNEVQHHSIAPNVAGIAVGRSWRVVCERLGSREAKRSIDTGRPDELYSNTDSLGRQSVTSCDSPGKDEASQLQEVATSFRIDENKDTKNRLSFAIGNEPLGVDVSVYNSQLQMTVINSSSQLISQLEDDFVLEMDFFRYNF